MDVVRMKQLGVGEDVRSPVTPTECAHSLGRLGDEWAREHKGHVIGWVNKDMWVWEGAPWVHMMVMCDTKGAHTSLSL
jgi:hypothetical protein